MSITVLALPRQPLGLSVAPHGGVGKQAIATLVEAWRAEPPQRFGGLAVTSVVDRKAPRHTGSTTRDLPGNVLVFELQAEGAAACRLVVRPSGTEPKAKLYALARSTEPTPADRLEAVQAEIDGIVESVLADWVNAMQLTGIIKRTILNSFRA